jgi:hypothetical protein
VTQLLMPVGGRIIFLPHRLWLLLAVKACTSIIAFRENPLLVERAFSAGKSIFEAKGVLLSLLRRYTQEHDGFTSGSLVETIHWTIFRYLNAHGFASGKLANMCPQQISVSDFRVQKFVTV